MPWWDIKKLWLFKVRKQFSDSSGKFHPISHDDSWNWLTFSNDSSQSQGWTMWSKQTWELKCNNGLVAKTFVFDKVLTDNFQACYFLNRKIWVVLKLFQRAGEFLSCSPVRHRASPNELFRGKKLELQDITGFGGEEGVCFWRKWVGCTVICISDLRLACAVAESPN